MNRSREYWQAKSENLKASTQPAITWSDAS
jgi:hypothetical protein